MLIDCTTCVARDIACGDCVVSLLLDTPAPVRNEPVGDVIALDDAERAALYSLAAAGLVPPLRLVRPLGPPAPGAGRPASSFRVEVRRPGGELWDTA